MALNATRTTFLVLLTIPIAPIPPTTNCAAQTRLDNESQIDPELAEGPASGGKIAAFAIAIAVVLGAVFYGLNNTSVEPRRHVFDRAEHAVVAARRRLRECVT